jgi:hypothetical protein
MTMENEVRMIDANALVQRLIENGWLKRDITDSAEMIAVQAAIDDAPTIDPESLRPKGRWELQEYCWSEAWRCSVCGEEWCFEYDPTEPAEKVNYCPNCGAKMEG